MNIKTDLTLEECKILIRLIEIENRDDLTRNFIIRALEIGYDDKLFNKMWNYISELNILEDDKGKIYIHHKKLRDLIDEQKIINIVYEYLHSWHLCTW